MKKYWIWLLILVLCFPLLGCGKADLDKVSTSLSTYTMDIDFDDDTKTLSVQQTVQYVNNTDEMLEDIYFHLYPTAFKENAFQKPVSDNQMSKAYPNGKSFGNIIVSRATLNNAEISPEYIGNDFEILVINLPNKLLPDKRASIYMEYQVWLPNCLHRFGYGEHTINVGNFYPIACVRENGKWNTSPYHANGDPFYSEMANYDAHITYDDDLTLASTGEQKIITTNGTKCADISAKAVRDFAFVLSDQFDVVTKKVGGIDFSYYYFDDAEPQKSLQCAIDSIHTFSKLFIDYPYSTYSVVKTDFIYGGMEYPNMVYISASIDNQDDYLNVIVHETAHQWWYNLVGSDEYTNPWQDEAMTEFSCLLFYDENKNYNYNRRSMIDAAYSNYVFFQSVYRDILGNFDTSIARTVAEFDTEPEYTYMVYVKGVLMYDSLYQLIGKSKLIQAYKLYAKTYAFQNATPTQLIACFEKVTNTKLSSFFDSWLKGKVVIA